jgi:hypothetical protein
VIDVFCAREDERKSRRRAVVSFREGMVKDRRVSTATAFAVKAKRMS